jgi:peptide/nickel transport system substrate-binding protein
MNARNALHTFAPLSASLALLTLILAGLLTACGPTPTPGPSPASRGGETTTQRGGSLTVAVAADVDGLDPHKTVAAATFQITRNLYDTLVQVDPQSRIQPDLATSWETSSDGLKWTFHLRDDVSFHNGRAMTAADVKYSFERILNPDTASPRAKDYQIIAAIETPDDRTVVFTLSQPQAAFLSNLAYGWAAVVPQEAAETLRDHPVGSGPFQFVEWVPDSHVKLRRFDKYFITDVPYLDEVTFRVITDPAARLISLKTGEVDVVPEVPAQEVAGIKEEPGIKVIQQPFNGIQLLAINNARPPFGDLRVRQALNHAIDKQAVIEGAQWGTGVPIGSHMPPVSDFYVDLTNRYPYDPEKAKALLAEAGYPNGFETTIALPQPYDFHIRNGEVIADQLAKVGIKAKLETIEWATYLEKVYYGRDYALTTLGHTGRLDPDPFLNRYVSDSKEDYMNYNNPRYDELAKEGAVSTDPARRREIYAEMQRMLADDAVAVYLLAPLSSIGLREGVQGWQLYPIDIYDLRTVWRGR